ncbi:MAG: hypothetical protein ACRDTP_07350 [Mycobacteriales bacterium]
MARLHSLLLAAWVAGGDVRGRMAAGHDRGDIPGWVMIAIMSAAVVVVLIPLVGPAIAHAFNNAIDNVSNTPSTGG